MRNSGVQHGMADFGRPEYIEQLTEDMTHVVAHGYDGYGVRSCAVSEREQHPIWGAGTLEELADILGYESKAKDTFLSEVARYNGMCYNGPIPITEKIKNSSSQSTSPRFMPGWPITTRARPEILCVLPGS
jgi:hypothetical protein